MKCPLCKVEMKIIKSRNVITNDDTPDEETKLYREMDYSCPNKSCENNGKVVETTRTEIPIG